MAVQVCVCGKPIITRQVNPENGTFILSQNTVTEGKERKLQSCNCNMLTNPEMEQCARILPDHCCTNCNVWSDPHAQRAYWAELQVQECCTCGHEAPWEEGGYNT